MVSNSTARISKFLAGVYKDTVKECRKTMLLKEMNLFSQIFHTQQIDGEKLKENESENKRARTDRFNFSQQRSDSENHS